MKPNTCISTHDLMLRGATLRVLMALNRDGLEATVADADCSEPLIRCYVGTDCFDVRIAAAREKG